MDPNSPLTSQPMVVKPEPTQAPATVADTQVSLAQPAAETSPNPMASSVETDVSSVKEMVPLKLIEETGQSLEATASQAPGQVVNQAMPISDQGYRMHSTLKRKAVIVSVFVTAVVLLITGLSLWAQTKVQLSSEKTVAGGVPIQDAHIDGAVLDVLPAGFAGSSQALMVNGDIVANGQLKVGTQAYVALVAPAGLNTNQTLVLPNATGTLCLDSNNCNFVTPTQLTAVQNQLLARGGADGTAVINGQTGTLSLQGTTNQITVTTSAGSLTLSLPQDIATGSSPVFSNLLLNGNLSVGGLVTLSLDCGAYANGGTLTTNTSGQIVCGDDDGGSGASIGGSGTSGTIALFTTANTIDDSLITQALGTVKVNGAFDVTGAATIGDSLGVTGSTDLGGSLNVSGASVLASLSVTSFSASGNAAVSGNLDVTGVSTLGMVSAAGLTLGSPLTVTNGGTGRTSFTANGVVFGNGTAALGATAAPLAGQVLIGNAGGVPAFVSLSQDIAVTAAGVVTIQANSVALGVDTTGNYVANVSGGSGLSVSGSAGEGWTPSISLGALTANWNQTGAFDIILNNSASELSILESSGATFFGTLDVGDLTVNQTYTLPDASGTICLTSGNCAGVGGTGDILNNGQNGPVTIGTNNDTVLTFETNNIPRLSIDSNGITLGTFTNVISSSGTQLNFQLNNTSDTTFVFTNTSTGKASLNVEGGADFGNGVVKITPDNTATLMDLYAGVNLTGKGLSVHSDFTNGSSSASGTFIEASQTANTSVGGAKTDSSSLLKLTRTFSNSAGSYQTVSGDLALLQSNCTAGCVADTASILKLNQLNTGATGTVLNVAGAGTGNLAVFDASNTSANGVSIDVQSSSNSQYSLRVTSNNGATTVLSARADGTVGIGVVGTANNRLKVSTVYSSAVNADQFGINGDTTFTAFSSGNKIGVNSTVTATPSGGSFSKVVGLNADVSGTNVTDLIGLQAMSLATTSVGNVTNAYGVKAVAGNGSLGSVGNAYGVHTGIVYSGSGLVTSGYGLYIDTINALIKYGLYQADAGATNYFAGNLGIGDASPAAALTVGSGDLFQVNSSGQVSYVNGSTDTATYVCRNSLGQLAACNTTGTGAAFLQGGNSFGATAVVGAKDSNNLQIITGNTVRLTVDTTGTSTFEGLINQYANDQTFTSYPTFLTLGGGSSRTHTINAAGGAVRAVDFSPTIAFQQSSSPFASAFLFNANPTVKNKSGTSGVVLGSFYTLNAQPKVQADGVAVSQVFNFDVIAQPQFDGINGGALTVGNSTQFVAAGTSTTGATVTARTGFQASNFGGTGSVGTQVGVNIEAMTRGTNNAGIIIGEATGTNQSNLVIGQTSIPSGSYSIYNSSSDANYFNGPLWLGVASAPNTQLTVKPSSGYVGLWIAGDLSNSSNINVREGSTDVFIVGNDGSINTTGAYTQTGSGANTFSGAASFTAAGTALSVTNAASIGGNLTVDTNTLFVDAANNRVGIGTTIPDSQFEVRQTTSLTSTVVAAASKLTVDTDNSAGIYNAFYGGLTLDPNSGTTQSGGAGAFNAAINGNITKTDSGTATIASSFRASSLINGGILSDWRAYYASTPTVFSGTVTTAYGLYLDDLDVASVGTAYGVYQNGSSALNYFQGNVGIGDTSPTAALTVGSGDLFQVTSSGAIAAATGIATTGNFSQTGTGTFGTGTGAVSLNGATTITNSSLTSNRLTVTMNSTSGALGSGRGIYVTSQTGSGPASNDSGTFLEVEQIRMSIMGTAQTDSSSLLKLTRSFTGGGTAQQNISGNLALLQSNCSGSCGTDTANILKLSQLYASSTGAVLNVSGAGTGNLATLDASNASANGVSIDIQSSSTSQYALDVRSGNGASRLYVRADGNVGIGETSPGGKLQVNAEASGVGLIVKANATTPGDLLQLQDSNGSVLARVTSAGNLEVKNATITGSLTVNGHIISGNTIGTTTIAAGAAACTTPTVSVSGNDTAGTITITTGTGCASTGILGTVTFASVYAVAPRVVLSPDGVNATNLKYFTSNRATTSFELSTNTAPADTTTYTYNYQVIQ